MVTHILWFREVHKLSGHGIGILFDELSCLTVGIIIYRATAIIRKVCILLRHFHHITQTRENETRTIGSNACLQLDRTILINSPYLIGSKLKVVIIKLPVCQFLNAVFTGTCAAFDACTVRSLRFYRIAHHNGIIFSDYRYFLHCMNQIVQAMFKPRLIEPVIIIRESTESIQFRAIPVCYYFLTAISQVIDASGL